MQAIVTKYLGPTNSRGARVKATCQAGSKTIPWDYALDVAANHDAVAHALARKLGWISQTGAYSGELLERGGMPNGNGNCYVMVVLHARCTPLMLPRTPAMREALRYISRQCAADESEFHAGEGRAELAEAWTILAATIEGAIAE